MSLVNIKDLSISFGNTEAVKHANITIGKGEMVGLVGESGSGKSVSALSILGLVEGAKTTGSIIFDGEEIINSKPKTLQKIRGFDVGVIFQEPMTSLNPLHTIGRQIAEVIRIHNPLLKKSEVKKKIYKALDDVGLGLLKDRLNAYPHELSGGQRQRVMIAMAIANEPKLLIADEPTTALDVIVAKQILELLKEIQKQKEMAILLISHDLTVVKNLTDRTYVMKSGEVVESGETQKLFKNPEHSYTQKLINSAPKGEAIKASPSPIVSLRSVDLNVSYLKSSSWFGLKKEFNHVVKNANLHIPEGKTIGLVGESGSGKTTLAMALLRLVKSEGQIGFHGNQIQDYAGEKLRELRQDLQVVFQDPFGSLNPRMTVEQIISEGLAAHNKTADIDEILEEVGLEAEMKNRYPHEFSGGQRQRIGIARALALKPKFIVLDEPTSALDLTVQSQIIDLLKTLQDKHKISYLFITHDLRVLKAIAHEIAVMKNGEIIEMAPTEQIFKKPSANYTKQLIEAAMI